ASSYPDRLHNPSEVTGLDQLRTLTDYRNRQALYKTDPAIQLAHSRFPWVLTWDDHEVENNYATLIDEIDDTGERRQGPVEFARQRANSYQAYYEHMPIRPAVRPGSPSYQIYRSFDYGDLLRVAVLDTRQYRTDQPGDFPGDFGAEDAGRANVDGSMTGDQQEQWLQRQLRNSPALWNALAQQTLMTRVRFPNVDPSVPLPYITNLDQWDGYFAQRQRIVDFLDRAAISNPVVLAGDIHSSWFSDINIDPDDDYSKTVAVEFAATSISSDFPIEFDPLIKQANPTLNPQVKYFDGSLRGYLRMTIDRTQWLTEARTVSTIAVPNAPVSTTAAFATEAGNPGLFPA
ncbi:MAG: alkaline phosphatase D family protein, partial [Geodermatophilaceae bacterium]